jgi:ribosomal protein L30/L7E
VDLFTKSCHDKRSVRWKCRTPPDHSAALVLLLLQLLRTVNTDKDSKRKRDVIKKVIAYMTLGIDVSRLFSDMILVRTVVLAGFSSSVRVGSYNSAAARRVGRAALSTCPPSRTELIWRSGGR